MVYIKDIELLIQIQSESNSDVSLTDIAYFLYLKDKKNKFMSESDFYDLNLTTSLFNDYFIESKKILRRYKIEKIINR